MAQAQPTITRDHADALLTFAFQNITERNEGTALYAEAVEAMRKALAFFETRVEVPF